MLTEVRHLEVCDEFPLLGDLINLFRLLLLPIARPVALNTVQCDDNLKKC